MLQKIISWFTKIVGSKEEFRTCFDLPEDKQWIEVGGRKYDTEGCSEPVFGFIRMMSNNTKRVKVAQVVSPTPSRMWVAGRLTQYIITDTREQIEWVVGVDKSFISYDGLEVVISGVNFLTNKEKTLLYEVFNNTHLLRASRIQKWKQGKLQKKYDVEREGLMGVYCSGGEE